MYAATSYQLITKGEVEAESAYSKLKVRLTEIDEGAKIFPLYSYLTRACDNSITTSWGITTSRNAWCELRGDLLQDSLWGLTAIAWAATTTSYLSTAKFLAALNIAVIQDLAILTIQMLAGAASRSDCRVVWGLHAGGFPNLHFFPYVDYGSAGRILMVLPNLYAAIPASNVAGLAGVVLSQLGIGPIAYLAFKSADTNGNDVTLIR